MLEARQAIALTTVVPKTAAKLNNKAVIKSKYKLEI